MTMQILSFDKMIYSGQIYIIIYSELESVHRVQNLAVTIYSALVQQQ